MPSLSERAKSPFVKALYIGDSGTGKTGSLVSLLEDGYKIYILDMDNGLDSLVHFASEKNPKLLEQVEYATFRDKYKIDPMKGPSAQTPKAYVAAMKQLTEWSKEISEMEDTSKVILVVDSLSLLSQVAMNWAVGLNPTAKDPRQWYAAAQKTIEAAISMLTSDEVPCNLIVMSHITYSEDQSGAERGYASAIGKALGPVIPRYFNTLVVGSKSGSGAKVKRTVRLVPSVSVDAKVPVSLGDTTELPLETAMQKLFAMLKGTK